MAENQIDVQPVVDLVDRIRDYVNIPRIHSGLFADDARYNRVCSAMDMLGDTCQALRAYGAVLADDADGKRDLGTAYLVVFGALQVLVVQQDAAFWLCKDLRFPAEVAKLRLDEWIALERNNDLAKARNLRNSSIGHPVHRDRGKKGEQGSYFIVQMSLTPQGFTLMSATREGKTDWISVPVRDLVIAQLSALAELFAQALTEIAASEQAHVLRFQGQTLASALDPLSYAVEKLHEATRDPTFRAMGTHFIEQIERSLTDLKSRIADRGEPFQDSIAYHYDRLRPGLSRLNDFCEGRSDDAGLATILADFVGDRIEDIRDWAASMDEAYQSNNAQGASEGRKDDQPA